MAGIAVATLKAGDAKPRADAAVRERFRHDSLLLQMHSRVSENGIRGVSNEGLRVITGTQRKMRGPVRGSGVLAAIVRVGRGRFDHRAETALPRSLRPGRCCQLVPVEGVAALTEAMRESDGPASALDIFAASLPECKRHTTC